MLCISRTDIYYTSNSWGRHCCKSLKTSILSWFCYTSCFSIRLVRVNDIQISYYFIQWFPNHTFFFFVNKVLLHLVAQKFTRVSDIYSSFDFISCQYPDFDSCLFYCFNRITYTLLQFIFNSCWSNNLKITLQFIL